MATKSHSDHSSLSNSEDSFSNHKISFRKVESSVNAMKTLYVSKSFKENRDTSLHNNLNQKVRKSVNQIVPEANYSFNSSHKLEEQSPESLDDNINNRECDEEHKNIFGLKWKGRSSHTLDRSFSLSSPKHLEESRRTRSSLSYNQSFSCSSPRRSQTNLALSRRTPSRKVFISTDTAEAAARDSIDSNANAEEQPLVEKHCSKFSIQSLGNENEDRLKIMEKVEELKIELHRMFSSKSVGKEGSNFSIKVTHLEGKIESDDNRSPPFRCSRATSEAEFSRYGSRKLCQESQTRHCRPVSGGAPFVICYKCYRLLQLPADFLVSMKSIHRLRCGSCSEVLVYSFRPRPRAKIGTRSLKQQDRWPTE